MEEKESPYILSSEEIRSLPLHSFPGTIHLVREPEEMERFCGSLLNEKIFGFDTETKPTFKKGDKNDVSLIQLATENTAWIFSFNHLKSMPTLLRKVLESKHILKIAQDPAYDLKELKAKYHLQAGGFIDIHDIARKLNCPSRNLQTLSALFLNHRISKAAQTSNWKNDPLTQKQILYAATDAWVPLLVYNKWQETGLLSAVMNEAKV